MEENLLKEKIRLTVSSIYDYQKLRIMVGNRIYALLNPNTNEQSEENTEEEKEEFDIQKYLLEYEGIKTKCEEKNNQPRTIIKKEIKNLKYVTDPFYYELIDQYVSLSNMEKKNIAYLGKMIKEHPLNNFFEGISGCGPLMSGVIISYLDPYKSRHCSGFFKYAGLDVVLVEDEEGNIKGEGRCRKKSHLVKKVTKDKNGNEIEYEGISFNPFLKTKLIGVLGSSLLKKKNKYRDIYYGYKSRKTEENEIYELGLSKAHLNNMAIRYMIKMFLRDLWVEWRTIEGLPVTEPYEVAKLGMKPHGFNY